MDRDTRRPRLRGAEQLERRLWIKTKGHACSGFSLEDAAAVEPFAIAPVDFLDMLHIPMTQKIEQRADIDFLAVLGALQHILELAKKPLVHLVMLFEIRIIMQLQELFFAGEVQVSELPEPVQLLAHPFPSRAVDQYLAQVVYGIQQDAVLPIHGPHSHAARATPSENRHMSLRCCPVLSAVLEG